MKRFLRALLPSARTRHDPTRPAEQTGGRRPRRPAVFRPARESLERRELLSANSVVNSMVNEDFVVYSDGVLRKIDHNFFDLKSKLDTDVVSVSVGTDPSGRGMAAYVKRDGTALVWTDTNGFQPLTSFFFGISNNVKAVCAGQQGHVFVQGTNNNVWMFNTQFSAWWYVYSNVASFSSGTDSQGNTDYALVTTSGTAFQASVYDVFAPWFANVWGNFTQLTSSNNIKSVAAGRHGVTYVLFNSGVLYEYVTPGNAWYNLGGNVASVSAGVNFAGDTMADIVTLTGQVWENSDTHPWDGDHGLYRQLVPPGTTGTNPLAIRSATANTGDVTDVVLSDGSLWQYNDQTRQWTELDTGVA
jgi:hypothetical protein